MSLRGHPGAIGPASTGWIEIVHRYVIDGSSTHALVNVSKDVSDWIFEQDQDRWESVTGSVNGVPVIDGRFKVTHDLLIEMRLRWP